MKKLLTVLALLIVTIGISAQEIVVKGNKEITLDEHVLSLLKEYGLTEDVYVVNLKDKLSKQIKSKDCPNVKNLVILTGISYHAFVDPKKDASFILKMSNIENLIVLGSYQDKINKLTKMLSDGMQCKTVYNIDTYRKEDVIDTDIYKGIDYYKGSLVDITPETIQKFPKLESYNLIVDTKYKPTNKSKWPDFTLNIDCGQGFTPYFNLSKGLVSIKKVHDINRLFYLTDSECKFPTNLEGVIGLYVTGSSNTIKREETDYSKCEELVIPGSLCFISEQVLREENSLKRIVFQESDAYLLFGGRSAYPTVYDSPFYGCKSLEEVIFNRPVICENSIFGRSNVKHVAFNKDVYATHKLFANIDFVEFNDPNDPNIITGSLNADIALFKGAKNSVKGMSVKAAVVPVGSRENFQFKNSSDAIIAEGDDMKFKTLNINVEKPGTILSYISPEDVPFIESLTVSGHLYTTDVEIINKAYSLKYLDLSNTIITTTPEEKEKAKADNAFAVALLSSIGALAEAQYSNGEISTVDYLSAKAFTEIISTIGKQGKAIDDCIVPSGAFAGLKKLETIKLPILAQRINRGACANCPSLTSVQLPKYLEEISNNVFENCTSLYEIEIPSTLSYISRVNYTYGWGTAFSGCPLRKIDLSKCNIDDMEGRYFSPTEELRYPKTKNEYRHNSEKAGVKVYFTDMISDVSATGQELHFTNPVPPTGDAKNCVIYCPKDSKTAYYSRFGASNKYIEE